MNLAKRESRRRNKPGGEEQEEEQEEGIHGVVIEVLFGKTPL